ncbi:hypothetical protein [Streptomyces sp. NPDC058872]|uniref:hypothetical protein n=1 Tax=Streptomyces sp. NPDC058872 TaxID=3346661 RepID=UPI00368BCD7A
MRRHTTATALATTLLLLTGCSSGSNDPKPPAPTTTATVDTEAAAQACTNAVYAAIQDAKTATDLPKPPECASMAEADYLQTVLAVIQQTNQDGQDALQKAIEDAASAATPGS